MHMFKVTVTVELTSKKQHPIDAAELRCGRYFYFICAETIKESKSKALDKFHYTVPIKVLDNYDISVSSRRMPEYPAYPIRRRK